MKNNMNSYQKSLDRIKGIFKDLSRYHSNLDLKYNKDLDKLQELIDRYAPNDDSSPMFTTTIDPSNFRGRNK